MIRPGKMFWQLIHSVFRKPATTRYPAEDKEMPAGFRGKLNFKPGNCIGCRLCMRDCPTQAIEIIKVGEKQFEAAINLGKCIYCGQCVDSCLKKALEITARFDLAQLDPSSLKVIFSAKTKGPVKDNP